MATVEEQQEAKIQHAEHIIPLFLTVECDVFKHLDIRYKIYISFYIKRFDLFWFLNYWSLVL